MPYNIIVIAREVWDTRDLVGDLLDESGRIKSGMLTKRFEPEDLNALEMALQIKDAHGGKVSVLSLGSVHEVDVLRESLYRGADQVIRVEDPKFENGLDTLAASRVVSQAIRAMGEFDLVLTGVDIVEGENAQLGSHVAEQLGLEQATYVDRIEDIGQASVVCKRAVEGGYETVEAPLPSLLIVGVALLKDDPRSPRSAKARLKLEHKKTNIPSWDASALQIPDEALQVSTMLNRYESVPQREIESVNVDPEDKQALKATIAELRADRILR